MRRASFSLLVLLACRSTSPPTPTLPPPADPPALAPAPAPTPAPSASAPPPSPAPPSPPAIEPGPAAPAVAARVEFAQLGPFYFVETRSDGWVAVWVDADDDDAWSALQASVGWGKPLWAGHRSEPAQLTRFPPIHVVSEAGVRVFDRHARFSIGSFGFRLDYRRKAVKGHAIAMAGTPAGQAKVRRAAPAKRIKKTSPLAVLLREQLAAKGELSTVELRRLGDYTAQTATGTFPRADRIVSISASSAPDDLNDIGVTIGVVVTLGEDGTLRQVVRNGTDPTELLGLVDLDGDGHDEVLVEDHGYESWSAVLLRIAPDAVDEIPLADEAH